ncbi:hypothetical protein VTK56DRAFT_3295 [Thermocarpiscus australiensis]
MKKDIYISRKVPRYLSAVSPTCMRRPPSRYQVAQAVTWEYYMPAAEDLALQHKVLWYVSKTSLTLSFGGAGSLVPPQTGGP